jgi:hypothetical protein
MRGCRAGQGSRGGKGGKRHAALKKLPLGHQAAVGGGNGGFSAQQAAHLALPSFVGSTAAFFGGAAAAPTLKP